VRLRLRVPVARLPRQVPRQAASGLPLALVHAPPVSARMRRLISVLRSAA